VLPMITKRTGRRVRIQLPGHCILESDYVVGKAAVGGGCQDAVRAVAGAAGEAPLAERK
jgi:hypothetical protein